MPMVENPPGALWIDIHDVSEVDGIRRRLTELCVPVTALVADPACSVAVEEVAWGDLYPKIVPRNGPEPGIIVQPGEIPRDHTLLLVAQKMVRAVHRRNVVIMLRLIRGPVPSCSGEVLTPARPPVRGVPPFGSRRPTRQASDPRVEPGRWCLMLRTERADQPTQGQLCVLQERLPDPLMVESRSWEFWVSCPGGLPEALARDLVQSAIEEAGLYLIKLA